MINIILIFIEMIICYVLLLLLCKKFKTDGIYVYGIIATFISCIMSLKQIELMGVNVPIGFAVTTSLIIAGNMITQKRGPEELKTYLSLVLVTALISCSFLNLSGIIDSSEYNKLSNISYDNIFKYNLRIYLGLTISIIISIYLSSKLYYLLKRLQNKIILSNIFSIIIVELLENILFVFIAYLFEYEPIDLILCLVIRYMIKTVIGLIGTITIYIANKYKQ
ncbi:MAG: queuosine precursor transporter [Erysipelotrichaceae bacterium]|nr:queuosine precursor transporter [Erysipelotrichaceae bacterium]MDD6093472.1 queuosine precursor transporter [bacterium]